MTTIDRDNLNGYALTGYREIPGRECPAFHGTLTHYGVRVAEASNSGDGGPDLLRPFDKDGHALISEFEAFATAWYAGTKYAGIADTDALIGALVDAVDINRKRGVAFLIDDEQLWASDDDELGYRILKLPKGADRADAIAYLLDTYAGRNLRVWDPIAAAFIPAGGAR